MSAEAYPLANQVFDVIDLIILLSFASEILLKWLDSFTKFWSNRWNTFDFVITLLSALPNIVYLFASDNPAQSRQLKGIARDLRILRTLRTFKAIARFGSLQIIVKTILDAFSSMTFIMLTLLLVTYIVAVLGIQLFAEYTNSTRTDLLYKDYFKSVLRSGMTLFQLLTLDNWYQIQREIGTVVNPAITSIYFIFWVWIGAFIFRNIFIGVMVKNFQILSERLAAEEEEAKKKKKLERLSQQLHKNLSLQSSALRTRGGAAAAGAGDPSRVGPKESVADWAALAAGVVSDEPIDESDLKRAPVNRRDSRGNIRPLPQPRADSRASSRQMLVRPMTGPGGTRDSPVLTGLNMMLVGSADGWDADLARGMKAIAASKQEIRWPRDTLFKYFQVMESMQENQMEYYQLQMLLTSALNAIHDE
jgi:cation channel sperm-associated protein 2